MSKERLEQMEHDYKNAFPINIEWLLNYAKEQADRVEDLERQVKGAIIMYETRLAKSDKFQQQNKRYRELLIDLKQVLKEHGLSCGVTLNIIKTMINDVLEENSNE